MKHKIIQLPENYNGILIVGEAPGYDETTSVRYSEKYKTYIGKPFIGAEGKYLRSICEAINFPFEKCAVTNTVHETPHKNKYSNLSPEVIAEGKEALRKDIERLKPNLIISIGAKSLETLTGKFGITKYRGSVLPCTLVPGYKVFATIHPGFIFKGMPQYDVVLRIDLKKALEEQFPEIIYPRRDINVIYDASRAMKLLYDCCFKQHAITVDIETAGSRLLSYGFALSTSEAYVIPKELLKNTQVLKAVSEFASSPAPKIYHNCLYDVFYLAYHYKILSNSTYFDTMIAQHSIFPTLPKSLAFCASIFTKEPYWKDEGHEVTKDYAPNKIINWEQFYIYNGKDCCVTHEVYEKQQEELAHWGVSDVYNLMMRSVPHVLYSMMEGCDINWKNVKSFKDMNEKAIDVLEKIKLETLGDVNFRSKKQVCALLYDHWGLPVQRNKGKETADVGALTYLSSFPTSVQPYLGLIKKTREHLKLRDFYNLTVANDGKLHWTSRPTGTTTGRWSTSKDIVSQSGFNMQNQTKKVRFFYDAPPDHIFLEWDLSNVDARFVAALCEDEDWLHSFDIIDNHSLNAVNLFKPAEFYDKISTLSSDKDSLLKFKRENGDFLKRMYKKARERYSGDKTFRDYAKKIGHATNYLEGPIKTARTLECSVKEAKALIANYKRLRPFLEKWHNRVNKEVRKTRLIRTFSGRIIQFFGPYHTWAQQLPAAVAAEPQSSAGDYLMMGGLNALDNIPEIGFSLQVHDSIRVICKNDLSLLKTIIPKIKKYVEFPIVVRGLDMVIPADFQIGTNWGKMKEIKDLNKIDEVYKEVNDAKESSK